MGVVDQQIQSGIRTIDSPRVVRGSNGTLYAFYTKSATSILWGAYSTDGGLTWNEVSSTIGISTLCLAVAIDSQDIVHVVYRKASDTKPYYKQFSNFLWGSEEAIDTTVTVNSGMDVAVDSADNVHVTWVISGNAESLVYNKRTAGVWAAATNFGSSDGGVREFPRIAIDSHNYIYIVFQSALVTRTVSYMKYTNFWSAQVQIGTGSGDVNVLPTLAIDSADNVHVVWAITNATVLKYTKYTFATDTWSAEATVTTSTAAVARPTISVDASDNLNVVYSSTLDIFLIRNTGSWGAESKILDATSPDSFTSPQIQSTVYPIIASQHTNIPTTGYHFTYINTNGPILRYYSSADINFPAAQTKNYSRKAAAALPSNDSNLSTLFTSPGYTNVATENSVYESQAATDQYAIYLFKDKGSSSSASINVTWIGKSSIAPTTSTVYLQIYNRTSGLWETLASNSSAAVSTPFTLTGSITSSLSNYYDGSNWISCRVYQLAQ